jgi:hypothetical protein
VTSADEPGDVSGTDLRYTDVTEPGLRRVRRGARTVVVDEKTGKLCRRTETLDRISALAVPPGWSDVWICADADGHIQATGLDERGRRQYRYHAEFRAHREATKFADLAAFGDALADIRARCRRELGRQAMDRERMSAVVVVLLERTLIRVGTARYVHDGTVTSMCVPDGSGSDSAASPVSPTTSPSRTVAWRESSVAARTSRASTSSSGWTTTEASTPCRRATSTSSSRRSAVGP